LRTLVWKVHPRHRNKSKMHKYYHRENEEK
jgi:hypothetical protein